MPETGDNSQPRLNVNITDSTADAIRGYAEAQGVSLTEAVRRLIAYGHLVVTANRQGKKVLIKDGNGTVQVILVHA